MTTSQALMTADELWRLPDDGQHRELVKGELRMMAPAGSGHGAIIMNLAAPLTAYVKQKNLGVVFAAETGFVLSRDPDTVRAPDIAFVSRARIPASGIPEKYFPGPPDLAVEVVSPSDTLYEIEEKVADWLQAGTKLVWVLNPRQRTVAIYHSGPTVKILSQQDSLPGEDVVPGFVCSIAELFV